MPKTGETKLGGRLIGAMGEVRKWAAGEPSGVKVSKVAVPKKKPRGQGRARGPREASPAARAAFKKVRVLIDVESAGMTPAERRKLLARLREWSADEAARLAE